MTFLQVALNGDRLHDAVPKTPEAIAADTEAVVKAGAHSVHVHAFDADGRETLHAAECAAALTAIRARCPGIPVSLTTSASIERDPAKRLALVKAWTVLPDLVTANQGEEGIAELSAYLLSRGVKIEAGLLCPDDARKFVVSPVRDQSFRVMVEPLNPDPAKAIADAEEMGAILEAAGVKLPQVHHGFDGSCWAVNRRALERGHGIRTGMEDVAVLPDGSGAKNNAELTLAAAALIAGMARR